MKLNSIALVVVTLSSGCTKINQAKDVTSEVKSHIATKQKQTQQVKPVTVKARVNALKHSVVKAQGQRYEPTFIKFSHKPIKLKLKSKFNVMVGKKGWCPNNPRDGIHCIGEVDEKMDISGIRLLDHPTALNPVTQKCSRYACRLSFVLKPEKKITIQDLQQLFLKDNAIKFALVFGGKVSQELSSQLSIKQSIYFADKTRYAYPNKSGKEFTMTLVKHFDYFTSRDVRQDVMEVDVFTLGTVTNNDKSLCRGYNCYHDIFATKCTEQGCELKFKKNQKNRGSANIRIYDRLGQKGKNSSETSVVVTNIETKSRSTSNLLKLKTALFANSAQRMTVTFSDDVKAMRLPVFHSSLKWLSEGLLPLQKGYLTLPCHKKTCDLQLQTSESFQQTVVHTDILFDEGWKRLSLELTSKEAYRALTAGKDGLQLQPQWRAQFKYRPSSRPLEIITKDVSIPLKTGVNQPFNVKVENFKNIYTHANAMNDLTFSLPKELKLIEKDCSQKHCQLALAWQTQPKDKLVKIGMSAPRLPKKLVTQVSAPFFAQAPEVRHVGTPKLVLLGNPQKKHFKKVELHFGYGASVDRQTEAAYVQSFGLEAATGKMPQRVEVKVEGMSQVLQGACQRGMSEALQKSLEKTSEKSFDFLFSCPVSFKPVSQDFSQSIRYRSCHQEEKKCSDWSQPFRIERKESIIIKG